VIYPAQPFGGEGDGAGWPTWIVGVSPMMMAAQKAPSLRYAFGTEMFKNFVFSDPSWDYSRYEFSNFKKDTAQAATVLNATNPKPRRVQGEEPQARHLARLVGPGAHGARQREISRPGRRARSERARLHADVHDAGRAALRRRSRTRQRRLGIGDRHLGRQGTAPDRVIARKVAAGGAVSRSRPLCVYPQRATYKGSGSIDDAENFVCK
jgi:feruloyl esterase